MLIKTNNDFNTKLMFRLEQNRFYGSEDDLVKAFVKLFKDEGLEFGDKLIIGEYYEQVSIPEIGRRSDLIIKCGNSRLINIEFKLVDYSCVFSQATDHMRWADYSYVCLPMNSMRMIPQYFISNLVEKGIGLIVGNGSTFYEVFRARHITYKMGKIKDFRLNVLNRINKKAKDAKGSPSLFD